MSLANSSTLKKLTPDIEKAINTTLTMSPSSQKHLRRLSGCILQIFVTSTKQSFFLGVSLVDEQYQVTYLPKQENSSVQISGAALPLIKLASSRQRDLLLRTKAVELSGDSVRIQQIQSLLNSTNIDWEGLLATIVGDIPAHMLGKSIRNTLSWGKMFGQSFIRDVEEFIKYEVRLIPTKAAGRKQFAAIDQLYQATKNLEQKIKHRLSALETK